MRPSVLAVVLAAALLMPGAAVMADPPWGRGHDDEAHGGARYAGGPPPLGTGARLAPLARPTR
jgi:hypothetical protein